MKHVFKIIVILPLLCGNTIAQGFAEQIQFTPPQNPIVAQPQDSVAMQPKDSVIVQLSPDTLNIAPEIPPPPPQDSVAMQPKDSAIVQLPPDTLNIAPEISPPPPQDSVAQPAQIQMVTPALKECDALFNAEKKFCYDGKVYDKCDGIIYNPTTHICSGDVAYRISSEATIPPQIQSGITQETPQSKSFWTAKNTIRIVAFGLSAISAGLGFWQNKVMESKGEDMNNFYREAHVAYNTSDYRGKYESFQNSADDVKDSRNLRNGFYIGAGVLSVAGAVTFFF